MEKVRILVSIERWPPVFSGAAVRVSRQLDRMKNKHRFKVITLGKGSKDHVTRLDLVSNKGIMLPFHLISLRSRISRYLKKNSFDILHMYSFSWLNRILMSQSRDAKTIVEVTLLGSDDPESLLKNGFWNKLFRHWTMKLLKDVDQFVVPCKAYVESFGKLGLDVSKIKVIPRGAVPEIFGKIPLRNKDKLRKKLGISKKNTILFSVGAIYPRKNQMLMLEAIKNAKKKNLTLILAGEISDKGYHKKLVDFAEDNSIDVQFTGAIHNVNEYMVAADYFLFSSIAEGLPNVVPEALMSGLPVLSMDLYGLKDMVPSTVGIIADDPEAFRKAFARMIDGNLSFNRKSIRDYALQNLSTAIVDQMHIKMYEELK